MEVEKPDWLTQMEGILEALNEGVLVLDDCNRILFANECVTELSGFSRAEILGRPAEHFYGGADLDFVNQQVAVREETGRNRYEFHIPRRAGGRVPVVVSTRMVEDPDGRRFAVITFTDITDQKRAETQLREANLRLEERQREIERELALAARIQQSLAPQCLRWGCVAVETFYLPVHTIGGDLGVVLPFGGDELDLLVCDVSGHGISSALLANRIYSETMSLLERRTALDEMLRRLNRFVLEQIRTTGFYFTLAAVRLDKSGGIRFAGAGHPPPLRVNARGECDALEVRSSVLGMLDAAVVDDPVIETELRRGDRLLLYTDGLVETFDGDGEPLGVERLQEIIARGAKRPLPEMKQFILDEVTRWRHGPLTDDISLVLLESC